jgi:threonylcarbamoyladenosine tRNA methylthiotransferase MtaB
VKERAARLREKGQESYARNLKTQIGRTHSILVERDGTGRTETFFPVKFSAPPEAGILMDVKVEAQDGHYLLA